MIKTPKQQTLIMETKFFQKPKYVSLALHESSMFYNDIMGPHLFLFSQYIPKKKNLCSIQIQMVIKIYVIKLVILKITIK
jgi:hypothetical protein